MALDGAFLYAVKAELSCLLDGRIDKIYQPGREELILGIRTRNGAYKLLISAAANSARVHITNVAVDNPSKPPMFCMLLRKHLIGGRLVAIRQDGLERILFFDFRCTNELGDSVQITLACEIMGRYSNLIVIDENGKIMDSLRRVDEDMSRARMVLPGMQYVLPPRDARLCILTATPEQLRAACAGLRTDTLAKSLIQILEGISPILAREWAYYTTRGMESGQLILENAMLDRLLFVIAQTRQQLESGQCCYTIVSQKDGLLKDFSFVRISQYGTLMVTRELPSACETLDSFFAGRDSMARLKQRANDLFRLLLNTSERIAKRLANQREELSGCASKETEKCMGDLLSANLYALQKGDRVARVQNFYLPDAPMVEIPLDERLTPSQNAQQYYAKYRKLGTAEKKLTEQIARGESEALYIESVFDTLTRAESENEIAELRLELAEQGYIRANKLKGKLPKAAPPLEFTSSDGYQILVGRNNKQNDKLSLKIAEKQDIWMHTHNLPGSHVIVVANGTTPPDTTLEEAALLAAYHSKGRNSAQVPVDYCLARYVKKPSGAKPGMVIFTNNQTAYVTPDDSIVLRCAKR